jgi:hypothetical protein
MIALGEIVRQESTERLTQMPLAQRNTLDRHSSRTERTKRSAKAFRFGLRAGSRTLLTPTAASIARKSGRCRAVVRDALPEAASGGLSFAFRRRRGGFVVV